MSNVANTLTICKNRNDSIYSTPMELVKDMIKYMDQYWQDGDLVLDPCRGDGRFYNNLPSNVSKDWCEISEGRDFYEYDRPVDWIIGNPPFAKVRRWWEHSFKLARKGVCYINSMFGGVLRPLSTTTSAGYVADQGFYIANISAVNVPQWFGWPCLIITTLKGQSSVPLPFRGIYHVNFNEVMPNEDHDNVEWQQGKKKVNGL